MNITRRKPSGETDKDYARLVHHLGNRETVTRQFGGWDPADQDARFEEAWKILEFEILLCEGVPCGCVCVESEPDCEAVREILIHPDYQRRGVGTAFLHGVIAVARARGVPVRLQVLILNTALEFYKKLGFTECGRTQTHILMRFDHKN